MSQKNTPLLLASILLSSILCYGAYHNHLTMHAKAASQIKALEDFQQWKRKYTRLQPLETSWQQKTHPASSVIDSFSLHQNLTTPPLNTSQTPLLHNLALLSLTLPPSQSLSLAPQPSPPPPLRLSSKATGLVSQPHTSLHSLLHSLPSVFQRTDLLFDAFEISLSPPSPKNPKNSWTLTLLNPCLITSNPTSNPTPQSPA